MWMCICGSVHMYMLICANVCVCICVDILQGTLASSNMDGWMDEFSV